MVQWYDADNSVLMITQCLMVMLHVQENMKTTRAQFIATTITNSRQTRKFIVKEVYGQRGMGNPLHPAVNI